MNQKIIVKFYFIGDETGKLYTTSFVTEKEYDEWFKDMKQSIEVFSSTL